MFNKAEKNDVLNVNVLTGMDSINIFVANKLYIKINKSHKYP